MSDMEPSKVPFGLRSGWRKFKLFVGGTAALLGIGGGVAGGFMIASNPVIGALVLAGGVIVCLAGGIILFDSQKLLMEIKNTFEHIKQQVVLFKEENQKLKAEREKFAEQNEKLATNVRSLDEIEQQYEIEIDELKIVVEEDQKKLVQLTELKGQYEKNVRELGEENEELKEIRQDLSFELATFKEILSKTQKHAADLEELKEEYTTQNLKLQSLIEEQGEQIEDAGKQIEDLKSQLTRFVELYESMKKLVKNLVSAGDMYQSFSETIGADADRLDDTTSNVENAVDQLTEMVTRLNSDLDQKDWEDLDTDGDGVISKAEWERKFSKFNVPTDNNQ